METTRVKRVEEPKFEEESFDELKKGQAIWKSEEKEHNTFRETAYRDYWKYAP